MNLSAVFWNRSVYCNIFSLVLRLLKWPLISLNTKKLSFASAAVAGRVHPNTSKFLMSGKISGSGDTNDFIKVSGKSALSGPYIEPSGYLVI